VLGGLHFAAPYRLQWISTFAFHISHSFTFLNITFSAMNFAHISWRMGAYFKLYTQLRHRLCRISSEIRTQHEGRGLLAFILR